MRISSPRRNSFAIAVVSAMLSLASLAIARPHAPDAVALAAPPSWATSRTDLGRLGDAPVTHLTIALKRRAAQQQAFVALRFDKTSAVRAAWAGLADGSSAGFTPAGLSQAA